MSQLKAIERVTLSEQVASQLAGMISDGRWHPGEKLPPESELCAALRVGRSTLREALKSLAFIGMVRMRAGDGTYVAEPSRGLMDRILAKGLLKTERDLADVCETRMALETELVALAAERATEEDIESLRQLIITGQEILTSRRNEYADLDLQFHIAVANSSHNKLLPRLLLDIRELLAEWIAKSQELPGCVENAQEQHSRIFNSIVEHNVSGARKEMRAHLETFHRAYSLLGRMTHSESPEIKDRSNAASQTL